MIPYTIYLKYPFTVYLVLLEDPAIVIFGWPITGDNPPTVFFSSVLNLYSYVVLLLSVVIFDKISQLCDNVALIVPDLLLPKSL